MITEITKKQTMNIEKVISSLTVEQIEILNLHCEKVQAAWDRQLAAQPTDGYWKAWKSFVAARAVRTKALRKAGFPSFSTASGYIVHF